jgi:ornithine decarboxylase
MGLEPYGVSFHVGSQQIDISTWRKALNEVASIFAMCDREGVKLKMINMGGGFPAKYKNPVENIENYTTQIEEFIIENFGEESEWPRIIIEPGRSLSGDSGIILTEVILVSKKNYSEYEPRWVYVDIGKFGGLAETIDESIKYRIQTFKDNDEAGPVILAGPSCDSQDVLFSNYQYELPLDLKSGDKIKIMSCGSYTNTYASGNMIFGDKIIGFNGFETLKVHYI